MARSRPGWFETAATELAGGARIAEVARLVGVRRETISRALAKPGSDLKAEVERRKEAATAVEGPGLAELAEDVARRAMVSGNDRAALDAAKLALAHHARQQAAAPPEPEPEEEATAQQAIEELVATLPTLRIVVREGRLSSQLLDDLGLIRFGGQFDYAAFLTVNASSNSAGLT